MLVVIEYGMGNLHSVKKALLFYEDVIISSKEEDILSADKIVLPGVGGFSQAICKIKERKIETTIKKGIKKGIPFLGICLGMQLLFSFSEEGKEEGLGIIEGGVKRFPQGFRIPHIGWNKIKKKRESPLLFGINEDRWFYFVHSYYVLPKDPSSVVACCNYANIEFPAIINKENIFGLQFHPEKSGKDGLHILENFCRCS